MPTTSTKTIKSAGGDYSSLTAWEAAQQGDLTVADEIRQAECYSFHDTAGECAIDGWTTDSTRYIRIYTPTAERHTAIPSTGFRVQANNFGSSIDIYENNVRIEGISFTRTTNNLQLLNINDDAGVRDIRVSYCLFDSNGDTNADQTNLTVGSLGVLRFWNNILMNSAGYGFLLNSGTCYFYNNTVKDCGTQAGFFSSVRAESGTTFVAKNNLVDDSGSHADTSCWSGSSNAASTTNSSTDGTGPATGLITGTPFFKNIATDDFHLHPFADFIGRANGLDLSADSNIAISDDIEGNTRFTPWDLGACRVGTDLCPRLVGIGTAAESQSNISPAWPTHQVGDIALLFIESAGGEAANLGTANGFAAVTNSPQNTGAGTAGTRITVYWCRATSTSMSAPTVTDPGNHVYGRILTFRNVQATGDPWNITSGGVKASASTTTTWTAATTTRNNCLIIQTASRDNDSANAAWSNYANAGLTDKVEVQDAGTALGNGGGLCVFLSLLATAGTTGSSTATVTSSVDGHMTIALPPIPTDAWMSSAGMPKTIARRPRADIQHLHVQAAAPEEVTHDKWLGSRAARTPRIPDVQRSIALNDPYQLVQAERESIDKWLGHLGRIVVPLLRGSASSVIDVELLTHKEQASIDRWAGHPGRIVLPLKAGRASAEIDAYQLSRPEAVTLDRFEGSVGRGKAPLQPQRPWTFDDSYQLTQAERVSLDKWGEFVGKQSPAARQPLRAWNVEDPFQLTQAERVSFDKFGPSTGKQVPPAAQPTRPWAVMEPFQLSRPEAVSVDRFGPSTGLRLLQPRYPTRPHNVDDFSTIISAFFDRWVMSTGKQSPAAPHPVRPRFDIDAQQLTAAERVSFDRFGPSVGKRVPPAAQPWRPWNVEDPYQLTQAEQASFDRFGPSTGMQLLQPRYPTRPRFDIDWKLLTQAEAASYDRFGPSTGRQSPAASQPQRPWITADTLAVPDTQPDIDISRYIWSFGRQMHAAAQPLRPRDVIDVFQLSQPEASSHDRWSPAVVLFSRPALQPIRPWVTDDPHRLADDRFFISTGLQSPAARQPYRPWFTVDSNLLTTTEAVSYDRWAGSMAKRVPPAQQPVRPLYTIDAAQLTQAETVSRDRFGPSTGRQVPPAPQPHRPRFTIDAYQLSQAESVSYDRFGPSVGKQVPPARQPQRPWSTGDTKATVGVYADFWSPAFTGNHPRERIAGRAPTMNLASTPEGPVTFDKWQQRWIDFPRRRPTGGYGFAETSIHAMAAAETLSMDKWYSDKSITPYRSIGKFWPRRDWISFPSPIITQLPDIIRSSTKAVVKAKTTQGRVSIKTTKRVLMPKASQPQVGVKSTRPVVKDKKTDKP